MTPRLFVHFPIFGLVFFVFKCLLGIARQWGHVNFAILTPKASELCKNFLYIERGFFVRSLLPERLRVRFPSMTSNPSLEFFPFQCSSK